MSGNNTLTVPCIKCKDQPVELKQPWGHSEYVPSGKCPRCGTYHYASYNLDNEIQVNAMENGDRLVRRQS